MNILIYSTLLALAGSIASSQISENDSVETFEQSNITINPTSQTMLELASNKQFNLLVNMALIACLVALFMCWPDRRRRRA
jgi:hypothetical protein